MEHIKFSERPWYVRVPTIIFIILMLGATTLACFRWVVDTKEEKELFEETKKKSKHIKIDDIGDNYIYLIIHNGDTVGVASAKK